MDYEILAPAGGEQSAYTAFQSGADAVYLGLSRFSARAGAENFDIQALERVCSYAHILGGKVYVALNTLVKDGETDDFFLSAVEAWNGGADAILIQDLFLGKRLKELYPEMELHLSTQAGCNNVYGATLAKEYGFSRVVLARETPLSEIKRIAQVIQTEVFVQGALCSAFSGQCYFSSFAGNNSGNRGRCKQPCRKQYSIDRKGYEENEYALSLSDLCVGEEVKTLVEAGVYSLKIEGRMRRSEYVAAAVSYYRALLGGRSGKGELSALKRTYNRGDYTKGLAFGQGEDFLSREVQGHIGERVGTLSVRKGKYYCKSSFRAVEGDGFKLLRDGREVGGGQALYCDGEGFYLSSAQRLLEGDEVRVTTDTALNTSLLRAERKREIEISLSFEVGKRPRAEWETLVVEGEGELAPAQKAPLAREELIANFQKTDAMPLSVRFKEVKTDGVFLPKSQLNAIRREFFARVAARLSPVREELPLRRTDQTLTPVSNGKTAVIAPSLEGLKADILILKPRDYRDMVGAYGGTGEKYLYLPPFLSEEDERVIAPSLSLFDGVYGDGYYALAFAKKYQKPLFAGTGFNLTNRFAVAELKGAGVKYFALSKELTDYEQRALCVEGAFALSAGSVKLMDLLYCPFSHRCKGCDRRTLYTLTDEGGREFPLRRYRLSGEYCRFEVYNCAALAAYNGLSGALVDLSAETAGQALVAAARNPERVKGLLPKVTGGHSNKSLQ